MNQFAKNKMKVIAIYNIKGGVGKTATSVNISYIASEEGNKVLLLDLDPQGASTFYFKVKSTGKEQIKKTIFGNKSLESAIKETEFENLDILPADDKYRKLDNFLSDLKDGNKWLKRLIKPVKKEYDFIIIDCPPNITSLSQNIFSNVDVILVPVIPTILSVRTYEQLLAFFKEEKLDHKKLIPFYSMVEWKKNMHNELMAEFSKEHSECLNVAITYNSIVERMGEYLSPVAFKFPYSESAESYRTLWKKLKKKL